MKKGIFTKFLLLVLAVSVIGSTLLIGGCGKDDSDDNVVKDVTPDVTPAVAKRTMASAFRSDGAYAFIHGTNSPDGSKMFVVLNETISASSRTMTGQFTSYILKMSDVTAGTVSGAEVTSAKIDGATAFRQSYTPDGTKIVQAAKDRVVVLKASDLSVLHSTTDVGGGSAAFENHDALTIDNDYALLALQSKATATTNTVVAKVVLYDLNTGAAVGAAANICTPCHDSVAAGGTGGAAKNHPMCGIDGKFTKGSDGKYTGTLYSSSVAGGHIVGVDLVIDPSNTTAPITASNKFKKQIADSNVAEGTAKDIPMFHDVRYDADAKRVYYSAIGKDSTGGATDGRVHMGYIDLADNNSAHDATISLKDGSAGPIYCGSGLTGDYFIPQTMNYPAYIDAVPKSLITKGAAINP